MLFAMILLATSTYFLIEGNSGAAYQGYGFAFFIITVILIYRMEGVKKVTTEKKTTQFKFAGKDFCIRPVDILYLLKTKEKEYRNKNCFEQDMPFSEFLYKEYIRPQITDIFQAHFQLVQEGLLLPRKLDVENKYDLNYAENKVKQAFFFMFTDIYPINKEVRTYYLMRQLKLFPRDNRWESRGGFQDNIEESALQDIERTFNLLYEATGKDQSLFKRFLLKKDLILNFTEEELSLENFKINKNLSVEDNVFSYFNIEDFSKTFSNIYCEVKETHSECETMRYSFNLNVRDYLTDKEILVGAKTGFFSIRLNKDIKLFIDIKNKANAQQKVPDDHYYAHCWLKHKYPHTEEFHDMGEERYNRIKELAPELNINQN